MSGIQNAIPGALPVAAAVAHSSAPPAVHLSQQERRIVDAWRVNHPAAGSAIVRLRPDRLAAMLTVIDYGRTGVF